MPKQFEFADAFWFRIPLKVLVIGVLVFGILSLSPALGGGADADRGRAIFGLAVLGMFVTSATVFAVAITDSFVEIGETTLRIRFEAFFGADVPLAWIERVEMIDPRPRWRFRFGLSTNFVDRVACSHGGRFVAITLSEPIATTLWPRRLLVTRYWLAVRDAPAFVAELQRLRPEAFDAAADAGEQERAAA